VTEAADHRHGSCSTPAPASEWLRWSDRALVGLCAAIAAFAFFQILQYRYGRDQGIYAVVADTLLRGGAPYRDAWDFKPPGIYWVYALSRAVFGSAQWGIRLTQVLSLAALIPAFVLLGRRLFASTLAGILGATLAVLLDAQLEFWHTAQPESFGGVMSIAGLVLATTEPGTQDHGRRPYRLWSAWIGAGVLFGLAGLMKPQLAGTSVVAAALPVLRIRRNGQGLGAQAMPLVAMLVGTALSVGACVAWFASKGALGDLYRALFEFAPAYGSTTWDSAWWPGYLYLSFELFAVGASAPLCAGLVFAIVLPPVCSREREALGVLGAILFIHLAAVAVQSKFFPYHFAATYPFGALIAGLGTLKAWRKAQRCGPIGVALFALLVYVLGRARTTTRDLNDMSYWERSSARMTTWLWGDGQACEQLDAKLYSVADVEYRSNMGVVRWLQANTSSSDPIFIWGFEPFIYDQAGRRPASRYIYNVPQRMAWHRDPQRQQYMQWLRQQARLQLVEDLVREPPRVIVVERRDVFPVVTGDSIDSEAALGHFEQLRQFIDAHYVQVTTIGDFDLWVRRAEADRREGPP
jgi:4-amino-4-deoxy-L-arabinose transferase-like glycosyltransferase